MLRHFGSPFDVEYEGDKTINLYSKQMMLECIAPKLKAIDNLIFISSNDFSRGWNGDFGKERPSNILMIEEYSKLICEELPRSEERRVGKDGVSACRSWWSRYNEKK